MIDDLSGFRTTSGSIAGQLIMVLMLIFCRVVPLSIGRAGPGKANTLNLCESKVDSRRRQLKDERTWLFVQPSKGMSLCWLLCRPLIASAPS